MCRRHSVASCRLHAHPPPCWRWSSTPRCPPGPGPWSRGPLKALKSWRSWRDKKRCSLCSCHSQRQLHVASLAVMVLPVSHRCIDMNTPSFMHASHHLCSSLLIIQFSFVRAFRRSSIRPLHTLSRLELRGTLCSKYETTDHGTGAAHLPSRR